MATQRPRAASTRVSSFRTVRWPTIAGLAICALLVIAGRLYAAGGGSSRDSFVSEVFISVILVVGLQVFVGNTGILSFGHLGFAAIAAYGTAVLAIPVASKSRVLTEAPWGLSTLSVRPVVASLAGIGAAFVIAAILAFVLGRTTGLAATMISLAFLFMVEQVAKNWRELTNGAGNLGGIPRLVDDSPVIVALAFVLIVAGLFREHWLGRFAEATREDPLAAGALGIDAFGPRAAALLMSALIVAVGGVLRAQQLGSIGPSQFAFAPTIAILAMLVVGGMRSVTGAVVGVVLVSVGKEFARFLGDGPRWLGVRWPRVEGLPDLFLAVCLLSVMLLRPGGLLGDFELGRWLAGRVRRSKRLGGPEPAVEADSAGAAPAQLATTTPGTPGGLTVKGLGVSFGQFRAVDDVHLRLEPGRIHGLIGPNGAGKSTVVNALTGVVDSTGTVKLDEGATTRSLLHNSPVVIARAGLARTFQNLRLFSNLTVRENVELAALVAARHRSNRAAPSADELLASAGLTAVADRRAHSLDYGSQRRLEIARAAALAPSLLLLDEPTSGMSDEESLAMVDHVKKTAASVGASVLVIDHDLGFITGICDEITVLDRGRVLACGTPDEIRANANVRAAYLGREG